MTPTTPERCTVTLRTGDRCALEYGHAGDHITGVAGVNRQVLPVDAPTTTPEERARLTQLAKWSRHSPAAQNKAEFHAAMPEGMCLRLVADLEAATQREANVLTELRRHTSHGNANGAIGLIRDLAQAAMSNQGNADEAERQLVEAQQREAQLKATVAQLETALRIIAGQQQCIDNLMSDKDIARAALTDPSATPAGEQ